MPVKFDRNGNPVTDFSDPQYAYLRRAGIGNKELQEGHNTDKVGKVLGEFKRGTLRSSSGDKVTDRDQAVAIALSEQRRAGKS